MKLYIYATRDLHDDKPHIFYTEDMSEADIGNQYEVLKSFFVDYLRPEDDDMYDGWIKYFEGKPAIFIPKGTIITITDLEPDGTICFEADGKEFCSPADVETIMYMRYLEPIAASTQVYIKNSISNSNIRSIRNNLFLYYGVLKNESEDFFNDFDNVIYQEELNEEEDPEARQEFYDTYLPLVNKCKEIIRDIKKDVTGHVVDQTIRYEMYDMAKEIVLNFPEDWGMQYQYAEPELI